jgi:hypothetical protein
MIIGYLIIFELLDGGVWKTKISYAKAVSWAGVSEERKLHFNSS